MRPILVLAALALLAGPARAEWSSAYTEHARETDCAVVASSPADEGDWADFVCPGYKGYPYVITYGDVRESVTYGFSAGRGMATFGAFNHSSDRIEWRIWSENGTERPLGAIHRWFIASPEGNFDHEILVVSKVGQPSEAEACAIGFIDAGRAGANQRARDLADAELRDFRCGARAAFVEDGIAGLVGGAAEMPRR